MGCSKLADRARLPIWFLSTERKHACIRSNWLQEQNWFMVTTTSGFGDYENACLYQNIDASFGILYQPHSLSDVTMSLWRQIITSKSLDQKKRKWKLSHRTDTLVKSKYLIISFFSWKEIVKLHETMWPIRDNNTSNGYLFEQESSGETLNTMFVDNRWLISLQYMDVSIPMTL